MRQTSSWNQARPCNGVEDRTPVTFFFLLFIFVRISASSQRRPPSLSGDTIDRLSTVHELLAEAADWPRVVLCAQVVPVLLHIYFNTVVKVCVDPVRLSTTTEVKTKTKKTPKQYKFFLLLFQVADEQLLAHLILVILERSSLLLKVPRYVREIHR